MIQERKKKRKKNTDEHLFLYTLIYVVMCDFITEPKYPATFASHGTHG